MSASRPHWFFIRHNDPSAAPYNAGTIWPVTVFLDNEWFSNAHSEEHAREQIAHFRSQRRVTISSNQH